MSRSFASFIATALGIVLDIVCSIHPYGYEIIDAIVFSGFWRGLSDIDMVALESGLVFGLATGIVIIVPVFVRPATRIVSRSTGGLLIWIVLVMLSSIVHLSRIVSVYGIFHSQFLPISMAKS